MIMKEMMKDYIHIWLPLITCITIFLVFYFYKNISKRNYFTIVFIILFNIKLPLSVIFYSLNYSSLSCITIILTVPLIITFNQLYKNELPNKNHILRSLAIAILFSALLRIFYYLNGQEIVLNILNMLLTIPFIEFVLHPDGYVETKHNPDKPKTKLTFYSDSSRGNNSNRNENTEENSRRGGHRRSHRRDRFRGENRNRNVNREANSRVVIHRPIPVQLERGVTDTNTQSMIQEILYRDSETGASTQTSQWLAMLRPEFSEHLRNPFREPSEHPYTNQDFAYERFQNSMLYRTNLALSGPNSANSDAPLILRIFNLHLHGQNYRPFNFGLQRTFINYGLERPPVPLTTWILDSCYIEDKLCDLECLSAERYINRSYEDPEQFMNYDMEVVRLYNHLLIRTVKYRADMPPIDTIPDNIFTISAMRCKQTWDTRFREQEAYIKNTAMLRNNLEFVDYPTTIFSRDGTSMTVNTLALIDRNNNIILSR